MWVYKYGAAKTNCQWNTYNFPYDIQVVGMERYSLSEIIIIY